MQGGVRKRGNNWYYYFDVDSDDGKRKKNERKVVTSESDAQSALREAMKVSDDVVVSSVE